jgi:high affinity sulfate transporter 1
VALAPRTPQNSFIHRYVPITKWLPQYQKSWLTADILAGLVVWALVVPEALAYAGIAGVPVQYGLYAIPLAVLGYMVFGTSRQLFVGPSSTVAALSAATVAPLAAAGSDEYISLTIALALLVGVLYIAMGLMRMGFIANMLAKPVLDGFIVGLGIHIAVGQLPELFGVEAAEGNTLREFLGIFADFSEWNWTTVAIGFAALALLFAMEKLLPKLPGPLVVSLLAIGAVQVFGLADQTAVVGDIPTGFAGFGFQGVSLDNLAAMLPGAIGIIIVGFAEAVAIAKAYGAKYGYQIDPSQEMVASGVANVGSGLLQGFTVAGSLSKSAAAETSGGKTQLLQVVVAAFSVLTIVLIAPLFGSLPEAALAAIVIHAVWGMIDLEVFKSLWKMGTLDLWLAVVAGLGVILIDILPGIVLGLALSLILYFHRTDNPHAALLGKDPKREHYGDLEVHDDYEPVEGVIIYRFDSALMFSNVGRFVDDVNWLIQQAEEPPRVLIVDFESVWEIDTTAVDQLERLAKGLREDGVAIYVARAHAPVRDQLKRMGATDAMGPHVVFESISDAVEAARRL